VFIISETRFFFPVESDMDELVRTRGCRMLRSGSVAEMFRGLPVLSVGVRSGGV
jgi:hypothetical protein